MRVSVEAAGCGGVTREACSRIDDPVRGALRRGMPHRLVEVRVIVRRIQHHDVERSAGKRLHRGARRDVADDNTAFRLAAERGVLGDQRRGAAIVSMHVAADGAAAQRFERDRAGAGKDVEHARACDARPAGC